MIHVKFCLDNELISFYHKQQAIVLICFWFALVAYWLHRIVGEYGAGQQDIFVDLHNVLTREYSSRMRNTQLETIRASVGTTRCRSGEGVFGVFSSNEQV